MQPVSRRHDATAAAIAARRKDAARSVLGSGKSDDRAGDNNDVIAFAGATAKNGKTSCLQQMQGLHGWKVGLFYQLPMA